MLRAFQGTALAAALAVVAGMATPRAQAHPLDVKLGLWEMAMSNQMSGVPPIDTSQMTPEQRARVEAMMAQMRGRANASSAPRVIKTCITKEKLEKEAFEFNDRQDSSCKRTLASSSSKEQVMHMECTSGQRVTSGDMRLEVLAPDHVQMTGKMAANGPNPMSFNMNVDAKWVAASCGDVK